MKGARVRRRKDPVVQTDYVSCTRCRHRTPISEIKKLDTLPYCLACYRVVMRTSGRQP